MQSYQSSEQKVYGGHRLQADGEFIPTRSLSLLLVSASGCAVQTELLERGFRVVECSVEEFQQGTNVSRVDVILIPATLNSLKGAFEIVHQINDGRFSPTAPALSADVIVLPNAELPPGVVADFRSLCCRVVHCDTSDLLEELSVVAVERARLRNRGVLLLIMDDPDSSPQIFLVGNNREVELELNSREIRVIKRLGSARRAFPATEIAAEVGCGPDQVRVYVERIKAEYDLKRRNVGVLMGKSEFITNPGRGYGYRLHARIKVHVRLGCAR